MTLTRRQVLAGTAAMATSAALSRHGLAADPPVLRAAPGTARIGPPDLPETPVWGYGGGVPGPVLRVPQGARLTRRFVNDLPQPSTVHWHGIRIANAMDGVPDLTQPVVPPGDDFLYDFVVPDAGTYWYHPHNRTWEQLARGLYGALIVEEPEPPSVDRDEVLLIDDWRLAEDGTIQEDFGSLHDWSHAGRLGNWGTVNGDGDYRLRVAKHERLRLRLVNSANARVVPLELDGLSGWVVALDGQPLAVPEPAGQIVLAPAQRADLIVDVVAEAEGFLAAVERDSRFVLATFDVQGESRGERLAAPPPLPANPVPALGNLDAARAVTLRMEGGAMGGLQGALLGGEQLGMRALAEIGKVWAFNGRADMPADPLVAVSTGETVRLKMVNDTGWQHAMHLHGHHFRRIGADGALGPLRDTLLVEPDETADVAFVADNPGDWLLHCHMVEHSAAGMMTWLRVGA